jgi:hypothetical protein
MSNLARITVGNWEGFEIIKEFVSDDYLYKSLCRNQCSNPVLALKTSIRSWLIYNTPGFKIQHINGIPMLMIYSEDAAAHFKLKWIKTN